jgi:methionyl-tRNA formyltransferase
MKLPRILFFGTSDFAIPVLDALVSTKYEIAGVLTTPDEPAGRGHIISPPPIKTCALAHSLPVFQPSKPDKEFWQKNIPAADLFIVVSYGKILPSWLLALPEYGTLNIHPSLLPKYRGPSPIQSALAGGEKETGVTIMLMDKEVDHGPIIALQVVPISPADDLTTLSQKLSRVGAEILCQTLPEWISGSLKPIEQDHTKATFTKIIKKEDGHIDWNAHADKILNTMKAYAEWPKCWTVLEHKTSTMRVIIIKAHTTSRTSNVIPPGSIIASKTELLVATGDYFLAIDELQPENKKEMLVSAFLRGYTPESATRFV